MTISLPFVVVCYVNFSILTLPDVVYVFARKEFLGTGYAVGLLQKKNLLSTQFLPFIPPKVPLLISP